MQLLHQWTWVELQEPVVATVMDSSSSTTPTAATSTQASLPPATTSHYRSKVLFHAVWKDTREPVVSNTLIKLIQQTSYDTMIESIQIGTFESLLEINIEQVDHDIHEAETEEGTTSTSTSQSAIKVDVIDVSAGPINIESSDDPDDPWASAGQQPDGDILINDPNKNNGTIYRYPIDTSLPWGVREWIGMGMTTTIIVFVFVLSIIASIFFNKGLIVNVNGELC